MNFIIATKLYYFAIAIIIIRRHNSCRHLSVANRSAYIIVRNFYRPPSKTSFFFLRVIIIIGRFTGVGGGKKPEQLTPFKTDNIIVCGITARHNNNNSEVNREVERD